MDDEMKPQKNAPQKEWIQENYIDQVQFGFPKQELLFSEKSEFQTVEVYSTPSHGKVLLNDGCFMLSERDEQVYHEMMAHVPAFLHPNPRTALVIGGGDGGTARELLRHDSIERVVLVEIDETVIRACKEFIPATANIFKHPKMKTIVADGVAWAKQAASAWSSLEELKGYTSFDIICVDSTDPVGFAQPLFGEAFYQDIRAILSPNGIVVSQAESPFYNSPMQKTLAQVLKSTFERVHYYNFSNLTYPGGLWSFSYATPSIHPLEDLNRSRVLTSEMPCYWYNLGIHEAAFLLPQFQKENLKEFLNPI